MSLENAVQGSPPISAALIGVGHFGIAILAQALKSGRVTMAAIADRDPENMVKALRKAGCGNYLLCGTAEEAARACAQGKVVAAEDPDLVFSLPVQVVIEATGNPEAGARHALLAIRSGKHVIMVNKETDSCVGPALYEMAAERGLIYTPVDGDQHGALIQLVTWARQTGLEVICGGKSRDAEFVYDRDAGTVTVYADAITVHQTRCVQLSERERGVMEGGEMRDIQNLLRRRRELLEGLDPRGGFDLCEMVIAANATGLSPDVSLLHDGILRIPEIPAALRGAARGGILHTEGAVEVVTNLREKREAGLGGGVFVTVHCENAYSQMILATKGCLSDPEGEVSLIYQPWHLCGVEALTTVLRIAEGKGLLPETGYCQRYDIVQEAAVDLKAGETLGNDHDVRLLTHIVPAQPVSPESLMPAHMLSGRKLLRDVPRGRMIRYEDVDLPADSILLQLRQRIVRL